VRWPAAAPPPIWLARTAARHSLPEKPFDFAEKAYWLQRCIALKAFVDQWLHIATEDGSFRKIYGDWSIDSWWDKPVYAGN
jgi:hypothetical protein